MATCASCMRALPLEQFVNRQLSNVKAGRSATCTSCATARTRPDPELLKAQEVAYHFHEESRGQVDGMSRKVKNSTVSLAAEKPAEDATPAHPSGHCPSLHFYFSQGRAAT